MLKTFVFKLDPLPLPRLFPPCLLAFCLFPCPLPLGAYGDKLLLKPEPEELLIGGARTGYLLRLETPGPRFCFLLFDIPALLPIGSFVDDPTLPRLIIAPKALFCCRFGRPNSLLPPELPIPGRLGFEPARLPLEPMLPYSP